MYMLTCPAGFNVPVKAGRFEVVGFTVTVQDPSVDSQFAIIDDPAIRRDDGTGYIYATSTIDPPTTQKNIIANEKGDGSAYDTVLEWWPAEPVKTRYGISVACTNVKQGSTCVYVR